MNLTFVGMTSGAGGDTPTIHADAQEGDLILWLHTAKSNSGTAPTAAYGTGFDPIDTGTWDIGNKGVRWCLSSKIAGADDDGAQPGGYMTATKRWAIIVARPDRAIKEIVGLFAGKQSQDTTGNPTAQTIAASASNLATVSLALGNGSSAVNSLTLTASDAHSGSEGASSHYMAFAARVQNKPNTDSTADMDDEGENYLLSGYVEVK